jgi:hypothetical protein
MTEASGLQAVFDRFLDDFRQHHPLSADQEKACRHIEQCRTEALGGLQQRCEHCGYQAPQLLLLPRPPLPPMPRAGSAGVV